MRRDDNGGGWSRGARCMGQGVRGIRSMTISVTSVNSVFRKGREGGGGMIAEAVGVWRSAGP